MKSDVHGRKPVEGNNGKSAHAWVRCAYLRAAGLPPSAPAPAGSKPRRGATLTEDGVRDGRRHHHPADPVAVAVVLREDAVVTLLVTLGKSPHSSSAAGSANWKRSHQSNTRCIDDGVSSGEELKDVLTVFHRHQGWSRMSMTVCWGARGLGGTSDGLRMCAIPCPTALQLV